ncbi:MAG: hypothetical protein ABJA02_06360 [Acidobacteriota bacterium]
MVLFPLATLPLIDVFPIEARQNVQANAHRLMADAGTDMGVFA